MTAKILKITGIVIFAISFIGGLLFGSYDFTIVLLCWVSGFISGMVLFGFGEVVRLLQCSVEQQRGILEHLTKSENKLHQNSFDSIGWECPKCGNVNAAGTVSCKNCGAV